MGRLPTSQRRYQLRALNDSHREILRLTMLGFKTKQIADLLGVTEPTVCNAVNGAKGRQQLAILRGVRDAGTVDIAKDIQEFATKAWEIVKERLDNPNLPDALALKYGLEAVGLAGHVKPQRVQVQGAIAHLTSDEILALKERARQRAFESGIVDVEYEDRSVQESNEPNEARSA